MSAFDVLTISAVSLSARRAWIEIQALLTLKSMTERRSPQGERG